MPKKVVIRLNNIQPIDRIEDPNPREVIVYHWNRIFAVLSIALVLLTGLIWGGWRVLKTSGETKAVDVEHIQSFKEASAPIAKPSTLPKPQASKAAVAESPAAESSLANQTVSTLGARKGETRTPETLRNKLTDAAKPAEAGSAADIGAQPPAISILSKSVKRVQLTSNVIREEPVDTLGAAIPMNAKGLIRVYLFMETSGLKGKILFHDWYWKGRRMAHARIPIRQNNLKAASGKYIDRIMMGPWEVKIVDEKGKVLATSAFEVR